MSLMDEAYESLEATAAAAARWRSRGLDVLEYLLDCEMAEDGLITIGRQMIHDLRAESVALPPARPQSQSIGLVVVEPAAAPGPASQTIEAAAKQIEAPAPPPAAKAAPPADEQAAPSEAAVAPAKKKPVWSPEARARQAERMRKRNAEKAGRNGHGSTAPARKSAEEPEKIPVSCSDEGPPVKTCRICGELKALEEFPKHPETRDGFDTRCKACNTAVRRESRERTSVPPRAVAGDVAQARALYREHLSRGGVLSNEFEGAVIGECGITRAQALEIRDEMLKARSLSAANKAHREARKWDTTPPYRG